ncbi:IS3 family transposase [Polynucleobacter asymbioticus]|uniref:IS3 family transposase n=1 Tax=Polynucleobacter asymbioticus TaxID=576611 RepID=UPI0009BD0E18|nr:IS3 family transposase [Polynucleobacter asymbioticus]
MAKSVYYYWREASGKADPYQGAKERITQIFNAHRGRYGYRRIQLDLRNDACYLNQKTVQKLMTQLGLKSTVRPKRYQSYKWLSAHTTGPPERCLLPQPKDRTKAHDSVRT